MLCRDPALHVHYNAMRAVSVSQEEDDEAVEPHTISVITLARVSYKPMRWDFPIQMIV